MSRIQEPQIILPALYLIAQKPGISTSELITGLTEIFKPTGEDAAILNGRNDSKFSQIVRNLVAHKTLDERLKFAIYERHGNNGYFKITGNGTEFLEKNKAALEALLKDEEIAYPDLISGMEVVHAATTQGRKVNVYDENAAISEGKRRIVSSQVAERSRSLRDAAIDFYSENGHILCKACDFDFQAVYGELGKGYIEIHHLTPLFQYEDEDKVTFLREALHQVIPLCANCHRMIHRNRSYVLDVSELRKIIMEQRAIDKA